MTAAVNTLREVASKLPDRRAAVHARVAVGCALTRNSRVFKIDASGARQFVLDPAQPEEARYELTAGLLQHPELAAETLGHVDFNYYNAHFSDWIAKEGDGIEAAAILDRAHDVLAARNVAPRVLEDIAKRRDSYPVKKRAAIR